MYVYMDWSDPFCSVLSCFLLSVLLCSILLCSVACFQVGQWTVDGLTLEKKRLRMVTSVCPNAVECDVCFTQHASSTPPNRCVCVCARARVVCVVNVRACVRVCVSE